MFATGFPHTSVLHTDAAATRRDGRTLLADGRRKSLSHNRPVGCRRQRRGKPYLSITVLTRCHTVVK